MKIWIFWPNEILCHAHQTEQNLLKNSTNSFTRVLESILTSAVGLIPWTNEEQNT
jgi:hypothetical protein